MSKGSILVLIGALGAIVGGCAERKKDFSVKAVRAASVSAAGAEGVGEVQIVNVAALAGYEIGTNALEEAKNADGCVQVPEVLVDAGKGEYPLLKFSRAPDAVISTYLLEGHGVPEKFAAMETNPAAQLMYGQLELTPEYLRTRSGSVSSRYSLGLFANDRYEGCLDFSIRYKVESPVVRDLPLGTPLYREGGHPALVHRVILENPNSIPVQLTLNLATRRESSEQAYEVCYYLEPEIGCKPHVTRAIQIAPYGAVNVDLMGARTPRGEILSHGVQFEWSVSARPLNTEGTPAVGRGTIRIP